MILGKSFVTKLGTKPNKVVDQGDPILFLGGERRVSFAYRKTWFWDFNAMLWITAFVPLANDPSALMKDAGELE